MERSLALIIPAAKVIDDGDMLLYRALPFTSRQSLGPFVFVDHYRHHSKRGIGDKPHPHAGIEVISYLLEGSVEHRDSMGFKDKLGAGDAQWICAGRGILHAEQPAGGRHGLQLWTSLPPELKHTEPRYASFRHDAIPEVKQIGSRLRVIAGTVNDITGPMHTLTHAVFAHISLDPGASITLQINPEIELGAYVLSGAIIGLADRALGVGNLAIYGSGETVTVTACRDQHTEFALLGGAPVVGALLFSGPFVMDTPERLAQAKHDFNSGQMGRLDGVPF